MSEQSRNTRQVVLGIDVGTTGTKSTFYNLQGRPVASAYREYRMLHPQPGWVEEDPDDWWRAVVDTVSECLRGGAVRAGEVAAIGVSCTNAFIPVSREGQVLHNAILQLDQRTGAEVEWVRDTIGEERVFDIAGNRIARGTFALPTLRWHLRNRPGLIGKTHKFLAPSGFIVQRMTGEFSINPSRMGFTLLADIRTGQWDDTLVSLSGLPREILPDPRGATEIVGHLTRGAAELTGLRQGTPVVAGAMDTVAAAVGAQALAAGEVFLALGTCGRMCHVSDQAMFDSRLMNCRHVSDGLWLNIHATNAAGASMRWFRDTFGGALVAEAEKAGISVYSLFDSMAARTVAGAGGIVFLPYLSGERTPIWDPAARGTFVGLSFATDMGAMIRAVMEGVAFSIRHGQELVLDGSARSKRITLAGGVAQSRVWCQILADVLGRPVSRLRITETETFGGAMLAAKGAGLVPDLAAMGGDLVSESELITPDPARTTIYDDLFGIYRSSYEALAPGFQALERIATKAISKA